MLSLARVVGRRGLRSRGAGQIRRTGEAGDGVAIAGLILGYLGLASLGFWFLLLVVGMAGAASVSG